MNKKISEAIRIISSLVAIVLILITVWMILLKIFGHSPSDANVIFSVIGILVVLQIMVINVLFNIKGDVGGLKEFRKHTISKINEISRDVKEIKNKINSKSVR